MVLQIFTLILASSRVFSLPPYLDLEMLMICFYYLNSLKEFVLIMFAFFNLEDTKREREVVQFYAEKTLKPWRRRKDGDIGGR